MVMETNLHIINWIVHCACCKMSGLLEIISIGTCTTRMPMYYYYSFSDWQIKGQHWVHAYLVFHFKINIGVYVNRVQSFVWNVSLNWFETIFCGSGGARLMVFAYYVTYFRYFTCMKQRSRFVQRTSYQEKIWQHMAWHFSKKEVSHTTGTLVLTTPRA